MRKIEISIHSNNMIDPENNANVVRSLVEFQVYTTLESQTKSLMVSGSEDLESAYPGCDVLSLPEDKIKIALGDKATRFLSLRADLLEYQDKISGTGITSEVWDALSPSDKINITLLSHENLHSINISALMFQEAEVDLIRIKGVAENWLLHNNTNGVKLVLRPIIHRLLGTEGKYFYALKIRNSDIPNESLTGFCSQLVKDARFIIERKNKLRTITGYNYSLNTNAGKVRTALTGFLAVVASGNSVEVVKPNEEVIG